MYSGHSEDRWAVGILASGDRVLSYATICATGVDYRRLELPNEERFFNKGLYYGPGASEAALSTDDVFVVGGGNSAGQAVLHFARSQNRYYADSWFVSQKHSVQLPSGENSQREQYPGLDWVRTDRPGR